MPNGKRRLKLAPGGSQPGIPGATSLSGMSKPVCSTSVARHGGLPSEAVAFSPDGTLLFSGGGCEHADLWDVASGEVPAGAAPRCSLCRRSFLTRWSRPGNHHSVAGNACSPGRHQPGRPLEYRKRARNPDAPRLGHSHFSRFCFRRGEEIPRGSLRVTGKSRFTGIAIPASSSSS